jgi:IPT/TIG domain
MTAGRDGTMVRRVRIVVIAAAVMLLGMVGSGGAASAASATSLLVPQSTAFSILGHSCGGIQEQAFATGFDATSGYPTGDVYLQTRCAGSGRGGHSTTYAAWAGLTWDFTGAVMSCVVLSAAPTNIDATFSAFDVHGNQVLNVSGSAYLTLAPTFVPTPRVTGVSSNTGPASGGTRLTITGTGFTGATAVDFGGPAAASFAVSSDTSITAVTPMTGAGSGRDRRDSRRPERAECE